MTLNNLPIIEVDHGIANRFENHIEINKHLMKYPHLLKPILEHEFSHTNKKVSIEDFKLDFLMTPALHYKELFKFMIKHPRSLTQLLPFYWSKENGLVYDFNLMVMYLMFGGVFIGTLYFGGKYL